MEKRTYPPYLYLHLADLVIFYQKEHEINMIFDRIVDDARLDVRREYLKDKPDDNTLKKMKSALNEKLGLAWKTINPMRSELVAWEQVREHKLEDA